MLCCMIGSSCVGALQGRREGGGPEEDEYVHRGLEQGLAAPEEQNTPVPPDHAQGAPELRRQGDPLGVPRRAKVLVPPGGHERAAHREAEDREVEGRGEAEAEAVHEEACDDPGDDRSEAVAVERGGGEHGPQERGSSSRASAPRWSSARLWGPWA